MIQRTPSELQEIPANDLKPAAHQGSVETLEYETYEAFLRISIFTMACNFYGVDPESVKRLGLLFSCSYKAVLLRLIFTDSGVYYVLSNKSSENRYKILL